MIYQGRVAEAFVDKLRAKKNDDGNEWVLTRAHPASAADTIIGRVVDDCSACDCAIAIVATEDRKGSDSGNAWFEIGLWIGQKKQSNRLKILRQIGTEGISDLGGVREDMFADAAALEGAFYRVISELLQVTQSNASPVVNREKIQAVLNNKSWLRSDSYFCRERPMQQHDCTFRATTMELAAELLRMGRANHERHTIEDCFFRLAYQADILWREGPRRDEEAVRVFVGERNMLYNVLTKLFNGLPQAPESTEKFDAHVTGLLRHKLEVARDLAKADRLRHLPNWMNDGRIGSRIPEVEATWTWIKSLGDPKVQLPLADTSWAPDFEKQFKQRLDFCHETGIVLQALSWCYFDECRKALLKFSAAGADPANIHEKFREAIEQMPHNKSGPHLAIWRREEVLR